MHRTWLVDGPLGHEPAATGHSLMNSRPQAMKPRAESGPRVPEVELSTNSLGEFVVLWNSEFQTVFYTTEPADAWTALVFVFIQGQYTFVAEVFEDLWYSL